MKAKSDKDNFLEKVPCRNEKYKFEVDSEGRVTIFVENKGPFNFVAQKLFGKPRFSQVHLEEFGSFIWQQIDGQRTIKEIADILHEKFGEKAEPLYPRISMYFNMLKQYNFIEYKEPTK